VRRTTDLDDCETVPMTSSVEALIHEYARRYVAADVDGVSELCETPFLAVREGRAIHLSDREAVHQHFAHHINAYRPPATAASHRSNSR
jgi:hypothetical protein